MIKKFKFSIYTISIGTIFLTMVLFAVLITSIGTYGFTASFTKEFNESAFRTGLYAQTLLYPDHFQEYLEIGEDNMNKAIEEFDDYTKPLSECEYVNLDNVEYVSSYDYSDASLQALCNTQDVSVIYVIIPSEDYSHYTNVFNCVNESGPYDPWPMGKEVETSSDDYKECYKRLYEENSDREFVIRVRNLNGGLPHVTALLPLRGEDGEVKGILCVQRFISDLFSMRKSFIQGVGAISTIFIILFLVSVSGFIRKQLVDPIRTLATETVRFADENTRGDKPIDENICNVKEIRTLASSIDKMENDTIQNIASITNITKQTERIGAELELAAKIQRGMLPHGHMLLDDKTDFDVQAYMKPAKEVGGDFYDFFMMDDDHVAIVIADVSDKGVGAAFFMAISKSLIKGRAKLGGTAAEIITYVDEMISEKNESGMFVTVWIGIVDLRNGHVNVCNAGHDFPAIMHKGGDFKIEKTSHSPAVAFIPDCTFTNEEIVLEPGDRIFLYTDGLNEAKSVSGERYGIERIEHVLNTNKKSSNEELIRVVRNDVDKFAEGEPQFDDMTMLAFTYIGR